MAIADRVKSIIAEELGVGEDEVMPFASFTDDLNISSLEIVELTMRPEEEFGIEIPDGDLEKMAIVKDAIDYIEEHAGSED